MFVQALQQVEASKLERHSTRPCQDESSTGSKGSEEEFGVYGEKDSGRREESDKEEKEVNVEDGGDG